MTLHGWAESPVMASREVDPGIPGNPHAGDICPICEKPLVEGESAHKVLERMDGKWVHDEHVWKEGMPL